MTFQQSTQNIQIVERREAVVNYFPKAVSASVVL